MYGGKKDEPKLEFVYRVEHKRWRHGPYALESMRTKKAIQLQDRLMRAHNEDYKNHPVIQGWEIHRCGFKQLKHLFDWFDKPPFLRALHWAGYVIRLYQAEVAFKDNKQLVYFYNSAVEYATIPIIGTPNPNREEVRIKSF